MMQIVTYDKAGRPSILGRQPRFWIITIVFALVAIALLNVVTSYVLVKISYNFADQARKGNVKLVAVDKNGKESNVSMWIGDLAVVSRSAKLLAASTDNSATSTGIDLPFWPYTTKSLTLQPQRLVSKIGSDTLGCTAINPTGVYSYACSSPEVAKVNRPKDGSMWSTTKLQLDAQATDSTVVARYGSGLLAVELPTSSAKPRLVFSPLNDSSNQILSLPDKFLNTGDRVAILIDHSNRNNSSFVLANLNTGNFLYYKSFSTDSQPTSFKRTVESDARYDNITCAVNGQQLACFYGPPTERSDDDDEEAQAYRTQHPTNHIEVHQLNDLGHSKVYKTDVPSAEKLSLTGSKTIYIQTTHMLRGLLPDGNSLRARLITNKASNTASASGSIYFSDGNALYEYNDVEQVSYLRFRADRVDNIYPQAYDDQITFTAKYKDLSERTEMGVITNTFRLTNNTLAADAKRLEDALPYDDSSLNIAFMDYSDNTIYVSLSLRYATNPDTQERTIDNSQTAADQEKVRQRLAKDGVLRNDTKLIFNQ